MSIKKALALLKGEYVDALAAFAEYLSEKDDPEEALEELDNKIFDRVKGENQDKWLCIYSALLTAI